MLSVLEINGIQMIKNPHKKGDILVGFSKEGSKPIRKFHESLDCYEKTPLVNLSALANELGVKAIYVKDESKRFGLKAFKGLGGSYVVFRVVCEKLGLDPEQTTMADLRSEVYKDQISKMVFITATDGNHGKGISWASGLLGCKSYVFMPKGSVEARAQAIRDAGLAEVTITDMGYDDTVRYASSVAKENGWYLVQDTSWDGYDTIPMWITQGYTTMVFEALEQMDCAPTHVFLQAGVGSMAGCVLACMRASYGMDTPVVSIVEPTECACIFESARVNDGKPHAATGSEITIMAGLNCAEPCEIVWPILRDQADFYFACPDSVTAHGMRILAGNEVVSGESGAVTSGLVDIILRDNDLKEMLGLDDNSVILLFSTEGDTDPNNYAKIINNR
ncbi:MAG: diaminopropionate ammonia-lyase [Oscillospiraceae bacterium]|nr:diaminopropionate ammonia-lyase [Oscillospiraceae bacterium]